MKVKDLIEFLESQDQELIVAYGRYSETVTMDADEIEVSQACPARPDGWVQNERPDVPTVGYLVFPGN